MPPVPDWLVQVLIQFPIVVVIGLVAWYCYGQVKESKDQQIKAGEEALKAAEARHKEATAAAETRRQDDLRRQQEAHQEQQRLLRQTIQAKDDEINRLKAEILAELRTVGKKVDKLAQKRTGG